MIVTKKENKKLYEALVFLGKAVSDDPTRPFMHGIYVDPTTNHMITTDGRRIHLLKSIPEGLLEALSEGSYSFVKTAKEFIIGDKINYQFPHYERAIPTLWTNKLYKWEMPLKKSLVWEKAMAYYRLARTGAILNPDFLDDLAGNTFTVSYGEPNKAYVFDNSERMAVLMPMKPWTEADENALIKLAN